MDIACPNCIATYRLKIELSNSPKALKCAACGHVFGVKLASDSEDMPQTPHRRVTGEINPDLKQMAEDEAKLRSKLREQDQKPEADAAPEAADLSDSAEPSTPAPTSAKSQPEPTPTTHPEYKEARANEVDQRRQPKEEAKASQAPAKDENKPTDEPGAGNAPAEPETSDKIKEKPITDDATEAASASNHAEPEEAEPRRDRQMGPLGIGFWAALILGGIASGLNQLAPGIAEAWPQLAAPLAEFQTDFASALTWLQSQWTNIVEAVQGLQT